MKLCCFLCLLIPVVIQGIHESYPDLPDPGTNHHHRQNRLNHEKYRHKVLHDGLRHRGRIPAEEVRGNVLHGEVDPANPKDAMTVTYPTTCEQVRMQFAGKFPSGHYEVYQPKVHETEQDGFHMKPTRVFCQGNGDEGEPRIPREMRRKQGFPPASIADGTDLATHKPAGPVSFARDCADVYNYYVDGHPRTKSGIYIVYNPNWYYIERRGVILLPIYVFCDMETTGGGWTVFQRRANTSVDFDRNWKDYESGFGDLGDDFLLGLKLISLIVQSRRNTLLIDLYDKTTKHWYVRQGFFNVSDSADNYKLSVSHYSGEAYSSYATYLQNYANNGVFWTADSSTYHNSNLKAGFWCIASGHYGRCGNPNGVPGGSGYSGLWWGDKSFQFTNATMSFKPDYY